MSKPVVGTVKIKQSCTQILNENLDRISVLFSAILCEKSAAQETSSDQAVLYDVILSVPGDTERTLSPDFIKRLQVGHKNNKNDHSARQTRTREYR